MKLIEKAKYVLYADNYVTRFRSEEEHRNQQGVALIATIAFLIMSFLNIKEDSIVMLLTTTFGAILLMSGYLISKYLRRPNILKFFFYIIFLIVFTSYTIMGGNDGFAALWLVIATYAVMIAIDFKAGFMISAYYLVMLLLTFLGPLSFLLQYQYNQTFLLRFPFLYLINFAFATYIIVRIRLYQYDLIKKQQELEYFNTIDLSTGLMNRNSFIQTIHHYDYSHLSNLSALYIDVNGLHEINNQYGHDAGDKMLAYIASSCKAFFPNQDIYRMGGDEFLILCRNQSETYILENAKNLFQHIEKEGYSISYGVETQTSNYDINDLVKKSDAKMVNFKKEYYKLANRKKR